MSTHLAKRGRRWRAAAVAMLFASVALPVTIIVLLYRGCDSDCGGGLFLLVSYLYSIVSSILLLGFSAGVVRRGSGHGAAATIGALWLLVGLPILVFGAWGVIWHIQTREFDNVFFYSIVMVVPALSGVFTFVGLWRLRARRMPGTLSSSLVQQNSR